MVLSNTKKTIWAIVPAAGIGARMQSDMPKQYLPLASKSVIEYSLQRLAGVNAIEGVVVALKANDRYWPAVNKPEQVPIYEVTGGAERCHSVLNALHYLSEKYPDAAAQSVWVLVHDAARPCVRISDIENLIATIAANSHGGLLAMPVRDTMKRVDNNAHVEITVVRDNLWQALTPQYFRLDILQSALESAVANNHKITDESQAMELAGYHPLLVKGSDDNIKITSQQDLAFAELYLQSQAKQESL